MNKTEKQIAKYQLQQEQKTLRELKQVYAQASKDLQKSINDLNLRTDMQNLQSIIYQVKYQEAMKKQIDGILDKLNKGSYQTINDYLQDAYHNGYIGNMYSLQTQTGCTVCVPINQKKVLTALQTDSKLSSKYHSGDILKGRLAEDVKKLKVTIRAELSRGIANGETWQQVAYKIALGMNNPMSKALNMAMRIARTEGHRVNQQGFLDAGTEAKKKGADIVKQWDATLDSVTRPWHQEADGQIREWDDFFEVGGEKMKAPSIGGSARNVCNCRCQLLQRAKWALDEAELKILQDRASFFRLNKSKSFDDFKQKYLKLPKNADTMKVKSNLSFESGKEANDYFYNQKNYNSWEQSITDSQKKTVSDYTYTDYQDINYYLRADNDNDENILLDRRLYGNKREEQVKCIDNLISSFELDDDITVYRSVDAEMFADYFDDTQKLIGKEITEKGYSSSSVLQSGMIADKDCKMTIHIPSGKGRGAYINNLSKFKDKEYEFLISRNSKFKIIKVEETENDLILEMEMIADG